MNGRFNIILQYFLLVLLTYCSRFATYLIDTPHELKGRPLSMPPAGTCLSGSWALYELNTAVIALHLSE